MAEPHQAHLGECRRRRRLVTAEPRSRVFLTIPCSLLPSSHASLRQSTPVRQVHTGDAVQVSDGPVAQRRATGLRAHEGLHVVAAAPVQEAGIEKLSEHISTVVHAPSVEHTVRVHALEYHTYTRRT